MASFTLKEVTAETGAVVQVSLTSCGLLLGSPQTLCRLRVHRAHIHVVLSHKTPLQQQFYSEYQFDTTALESMGFTYKPVCKAS